MAPFAGGSLGTASWGWAVDKACRALLKELDVYAGVVPDGGFEVVADTTEDLGQRADLRRHTLGRRSPRVRVDGDTGEVRVDRMLACSRPGGSSIRTPRAHSSWEP
ncbi:Oxidoreductase OS=Streptomyces antimycoticus OX=68175 GN=SSPO_013570 PE=4 SV=1 [Streptomyces antimycoticus]